MSIANPLWGAPRIHGELLKLGIDIGQTSVAKYMAKRRDPPSQGWRTFLRNHADGIAAMDLFVVPTISASASTPRMKSACASSTAPFGLPCLAGRTAPVARFSRAHVPDRKSDHRS